MQLAGVSTILDEFSSDIAATGKLQPVPDSLKSGAVALNVG